MVNDSYFNVSEPLNHHFSGLDESCGCIALLEPHLANRIGSNDGRDLLLADPQHNLARRPSILTLTTWPTS